MPVLEAGLVVPDHWEHAGDEQHLPAGQNFIVCLDRLKRDKEFLFAREAPLGVVLVSTAKAAEVAEFLDRLDLVVIEFPKFRDGRGFTLARTLRERYGFDGEIRATGHILPDQYALLLRCGFSSVEVPETADLPVWQAALARYKVAYQPGLTHEHFLSWFRRGV
jgi:uncharacterized protein (DUF934 family)